MDKGHMTGAVFIDLRKAFDYVDRKILLVKLCKYGILGQEINWFMEYLSDRKQKVVLGKFESDWGTTVSGVPQGANIGPLLYTVMVNYLPYGAFTYTLRGPYGE